MGGRKRQNSCVPSRVKTEQFENDTNFSFTHNILSTQSKLTIFVSFYSGNDALSNQLTRIKK